MNHAGEEMSDKYTLAEIKEIISGTYPEEVFALQQLLDDHETMRRALDGLTHALALDAPELLVGNVLVEFRNATKALGEVTK